MPCVRCNQTVKFADLTALAQRPGCERLATGHYVRRIDGPDGPELHRAADLARDQSWFLFATTREQLAQRAVSAGGNGGQARRCAPRRSGLVCRWPPSRTARTSASSPSGNYADIVARLRPDAAEPGEIVDRGRARASAGTTASRATRSGRASGSALRRWTGGERQVVVALDPARRRVVVGPRRCRNADWCACAR